MSQEKIESPDKKLIQHSESKKAMNGFQGSIVCAIILGFIAIILHRLLEGVIVQISLLLIMEQKISLQEPVLFIWMEQETLQ